VTGNSQIPMGGGVVCDHWHRESRVLRRRAIELRGGGGLPFNFHWLPNPTCQSGGVLAKA